MEISPPNEIIKSRNGIQVIARAAAILRTLKDSPDGLSLAEIAKTLNLPRSTVQRIVDALDQENLVIAASLSRGVRLGPALIPLAAATRFEISEGMKKRIHQIAGECGETVAFSLYNGDRVIFVEQVPSIHELRVEQPIGNSLPIQSSAPGKAIMARMNETELKRLRRRIKFEEITPHTITDWDALLVELAKIREKGVAFDLEEASLGISAVAVSLTLPSGDYAAISIPVPTFRFDAQREKLVNILQKYGTEIQKNLSRTS